MSIKQKDIQNSTLMSVSTFGYTRGGVEQSGRGIANESSPQGVLQGKAGSLAGGRADYGNR